MLWTALFNQQGNQFTGTIARQDKVGRNLTVCGEYVSKTGIAPIRVGREQIQMSCKSFFYLFGKSERIYVSTKIDNIIFFLSVVFAHFFNITSVKFQFCIHVYNPLLNSLIPPLQEIQC